jgi:hypothetical protein
VLTPRTLLSRVPGIGWVILFMVATIAGGLWAIYASGERAGERKVRRAAVQDSVVHQAAIVTRDSARTDSAQRRSADVGRIRHAARARVEIVDDVTVRIAGELTATAPAIVTTIRTSDAKIREDSITMATMAAELRDRATKDELQEHRHAIESESDGGISMGAVGIGVVVGVAALELLRIAFHR